MEKAVTRPYNDKLTMSEELRCVALLARGDSIETIQKHFKDNFDRTIGRNTIYAVKKRNRENFELIKQKVAEAEATDAISIKRKANSIIKKRLDQEDDNEKVVAKANLDLLEGRLDVFEYEKIMKSMKKITTTELVAVSKEMHIQDKDEFDNEPKNNQDLAPLIEAIKSGDEVTLQQIIFKGSSDDKRNGTEKPLASDIQSSDS